MSFGPAKKPPPDSGQRRVLFYRNPMNPSDTSPTHFLDVAPLYAGETVARIGDIRPAAEIVHSLVDPGYHST